MLDKFCELKEFFSLLFLSFCDNVNATFALSITYGDKEAQVMGKGEDVMKR